MTYSTRAAIRALSPFHEAAGEQARLVVETRIAAATELGPMFTVTYRRVSWWTPWVGARRIMAPSVPCVSPAFNAWWRLYQTQSGRRGTTNRVRWIEVHMNSSAVIRHQSYAGDWIDRYRIYDGTANLQ